MSKKEYPFAATVISDPGNSSLIHRYGIRITKPVRMMSDDKSTHQRDMTCDIPVWLAEILIPNHPATREAKEKINKVVNERIQSLQREVEFFKGVADELA